MNAPAPDDPETFFHDLCARLVAYAEAQDRLRYDQHNKLNCEQVKTKRNGRDVVEFIYKAQVDLDSALAAVRGLRKRAEALKLDFASEYARAHAHISKG